MNQRFPERNGECEVRNLVVERLAEAVRMLEGCPQFSRLMPEVRVNMVYALPDAQSPADVAGVEGRITVVGGLPKASGPVRFGASDHMARLIIELRRHELDIRAGINFRWTEQILAFVQNWCKERDWFLGVIDRSLEPGELVGKDRGSMAWKVEQLVRESGCRVPRVFYESRGWGKEPLFFMVGADPVPLAEDVIDISQRWDAECSGRSVER
ncbi:MAG: thiamine-phosphate synthase family protein [candidate division WOR-3 bacterium]